MTNRMLQWVGAGVLATGLSTAPDTGTCWTVGRPGAPAPAEDGPANGQLTKTPSQTRRYLLTEGLRQANLLGSMYVRFEDASQRPVTFACSG